ncbi:MAG TPA: beta-ketoacyl-ACP synthase III [Candidatus Binataceae bacterium]|nr:beta-ketoacyl-ACP synthase III [Candidatus Binataceae bacterium]
MGSRIISTGRALPRTPVTNQDLERFMETSDDWIRSRTGIGQRYTLRAGEPLAEIAASAGRIALERAGLGPSDLDAIIVGTVSSEFAFPSFACQVQNLLGVDSIPAFDVAAACSGFVYALSVADAHMRAGDFAKVLVIGADALSTFVDWNDRRTAVLFGDGAGAAVLVSEPGPRGVLASLLRSSGRHWGLLSLRATGVRATLDAEVRRDPDDAIKMKGPELFKIAVKSMEDVSRQVAERAHVNLDDVALVVGHQANLRIIKAVAERLGLPPEKVFINIERYGNTSAASVPIALDEALEQGRIHDGDLVMLNACGGGLTWGANLLRW